MTELRRALHRGLYRYVLYPGLRVWWWIRRPRTFGVRVVVRRADTGSILLIKHSYGRLDWWHVPGGGYDPATEQAADAARREAREEVGLTLGNLTHLGTYTTRATGNFDTVQVFSGTSGQDVHPTSPEVTAVLWADPDEAIETLPMPRLTRFCLTRAAGTHTAS